MKVKILTLTVICIITFALGYTVLADTTITDSVAPIIEDVKVSKETVYQGENLVVSLGLSEENEITNILVRYILPNGGQKNINNFVLNEETGKYESEMSISNDALIGLWQVYGILTEDSEGNSKWVMNSNVYTDSYYEVDDFSELNFTVDVPPADKEAPVVDMNSLEISKSKLYQGESFEIGVSVSDETEVKNVIIRYILPNGGMLDIENLVLDEETGKYKAEFVVDEEAQSGIWKIYGIMTEDTLGNSNWIMNSNIYEDTIYEATDMSVCDINVLEVWKDKFAPEIGEITFSKTRAATENKIYMSLEVTDDTGVEKIILRFILPNDTYQDVKEFVLNEETGKYEITYSIPENPILGTWKIYGIMAEDTLGNYTWTMNSEIYTQEYYETQDFSNLDIQVVEPVHVESISLNVTDVTLGIGESLEILVEYMPEDPTDEIVINYISSDENVAIIEENKIVAVSEGSATITVDLNGVQETINVKVENQDLQEPENPKDDENQERPEDNHDYHDKHHHKRKHHRFDFNKDGRVNHRDFWHVMKNIFDRFHKK